MLWPFALLAATDRLNDLHINMKGMTTEMKCSSVAGSSVKLKNYHTFGCPVYILGARLQTSGGAGAPKLDPRSRLGIYMGNSPTQAGNDALVLNPRAGLISTQIHVVIDNDFSTVHSLRAETVPFNWKKLVDN